MPGSGRDYRVQLFVFFCFSISVISCCRVLIVVSSLCSFDFYVLGDVAQRNPKLGLNTCFVYTTAELRARIVATQNRFKHRPPTHSNNLLSVPRRCFCYGSLILPFYVFYVLVTFLAWIAVWPIFRKGTVLLAFCL